MLVSGRAWKYFPTGPLIGVNGSSSPHSTKMGLLIEGIKVMGLGPGGPVMMDTNASNAPSVSAGLNITCQHNVTGLSFKKSLAYRACNTCLNKL